MRSTGHCFNNYLSHEISWTNKEEIRKILGMDAKHIRQLGINVYKKVPSCTNNGAIGEEFYQQAVFVALDENSFGYTGSTPITSGPYHSSLITMTFSGTNVYFNKNNQIERIASNGSITCGVAADKNWSQNVTKKFAIPIVALPTECRYLSWWITGEKRRHLYPL